MEHNKFNKKKLEEEIDSLRSQNLYLQDYLRKMNTLVDVSSLVVSSLEKDVVLKTILDQTKILMDCLEASVLLVDEEEDRLHFAILSDHDDIDSLAQVRLKRGEGIAGKVWESGVPVIANRKTHENSISTKVDSKLHNTTESLIAAPLKIRDETIGVMEAINKQREEDFNSDDLEIFQTLANQAAIAIYNASLYEMATRDGMTKLFIRRYFDSRLSEEFIRSKRYKRDLALIMFDIDHFKNFNDTYGHQLGDEVLKKTALILMDCSRSCDIPSRYGGEEFSIILPETDAAGAKIIAERVRSLVEQARIHYKGEDIQLTISAGVSSRLCKSCSSPAELIKEADTALYRAKEGGRNRVDIFS